MNTLLKERIVKDLRAALRLLNAKPRFVDGDLDSYKVASRIEETLKDLGEEYIGEYMREVGGTS